MYITNKSIGEGIMNRIGMLSVPTKYTFDK